LKTNLQKKIAYNYFNRYFYAKSKTVQRNYILPIFLIFQIIFLKIITFFPEAVERFYSNGVYVLISKIARTIFGKIPFSVGDLVYGIAIVSVLFSVLKNRKSF
jgi:ABC-type multidrug transport system permease subunit